MAKKKKRPGPGQPPKITEEAIEMADVALCRRMTKGMIKALLKERFGMQARSCETTLRRAKDRIIARTGKSKDEHRMDAYAFYDSVLRERGVEIKDRIRAQERIDKLLGLETPVRIDMGHKVEVEEDATNTFDDDKFKRLLVGALGRHGGHDD